MIVLTFSQVWFPHVLWEDLNLKKIGGNQDSLAKRSIVFNLKSSIYLNVSEFFLLKYVKGIKISKIIHSIDFL